jgi:hypothetical protein
VERRDYIFIKLIIQLTALCVELSVADAECVLQPCNVEYGKENRSLWYQLVKEGRRGRGEEGRRAGGDEQVETR